MLEELSRARLHEILTQAGWTVQDLVHDYGEDLLVRIFDDGSPTALSFFVQAKATDHLDRYLKADASTLSYPLETSHIEQWDRLWEPVLVTLLDSVTATTFWAVVQTFTDMQKQRSSRIQPGQRTLHFPIPIDNKLDREGLGRIRARTRSRFERFEREKEGAEHLIGILKENFDIDYDPQRGLF